jgi:hypothetical protein
MLSKRQAAVCFVVALAAASAVILTLYLVLSMLPVFLSEEAYAIIIWFCVFSWPISLLLLITGSLITGVFAYRFSERRILSRQFGQSV